MTDYATPTRRGWLAATQHPIHAAARRLWARIRIAQLRHDLWWSERHVEILQYDTTREAVIQADIRMALQRWQQIAR